MSIRETHKVMDYSLGQCVGYKGEVLGIKIHFQRSERIDQGENSLAHVLDEGNRLGLFPKLPSSNLIRTTTCPTWFKSKSLLPC
jgi:hypothetical protein